MFHDKPMKSLGSMRYNSMYIGKREGKQIASNISNGNKKVIRKYSGRPGKVFEYFRLSILLVICSLLPIQQRS